MVSYCSRCGKKFKFFSPTPFQWQGNPVCDDCYDYLVNENELILINKSILWQREENALGTVNCRLLGISDFNIGWLLLTNQRIIFVNKICSAYSVTYTLSLENITAVSPIGNDRLMIVNTDNNRINFIGMKSQSIVPLINSAVVDRKNKVLAEKQKDRIQIVLDFSALNDVMSKGGLVMTTYKCPNCNGMVKLPEAGKVLVCEYCGTPIKPVDVFEKIKSLIQ